MMRTFWRVVDANMGCRVDLGLGLELPMEAPVESDVTDRKLRRSLETAASARNDLEANYDTQNRTTHCNTESIYHFCPLYLVKRFLSCSQLPNSEV